MRIYVAGPYSPKRSGNSAVKEVAENVDEAIKVGIELIKLGHLPFVPHLNHYIHIHPDCPDLPQRFYYNYDLTFLREWAEALFYIGPSKGANTELFIATELNILIYFSLDEVPNNDSSQ